MNTIVNITGVTLKCLGASDESAIKKAKRRIVTKKYEQSEVGIKYRVARQKKYYLNNKEKRIKDSVNYYNKRRKTDNNFRLKINLRSRLTKAINSKNKSNNTMVLLGIPNIEFLWKHLEKTFKKGMTRENYGKWHVDHIIPCSSFDLSKPEEQSKCFHYSNLQALWAKENLSKNDKILSPESSV
jgi:hypothetical protein